MSAVTPLWFRRTAKNITCVTGRGGGTMKNYRQCHYGDGGFDKKNVVTPRLRCDGCIRQVGQYIMRRITQFSVGPIRCSYCRHTNFCLKHTLCFEIVSLFSFLLYSQHITYCFQSNVRSYIQKKRRYISCEYRR